MKYKVKDIDAESEQAGQTTSNKLEEKLLRTVRCSSVVIVALALCLIALVAYTAIHSLTEYRAVQPCLSEECLNTDEQIPVVNVRVRRAVEAETPSLNSVSEPRCKKSSKKEDPAQTASRMLASLNKSVDPCDDFYEYACGGWNEKNPVPEWSTSWDQLAKLRENLASDLKELLEAKDEPDMPQSVQKAKALYRTCIDTDKLEHDGLKPVRQLLEDLGLPGDVPEVASGNFTWEVLSGHIRRFIGLNVFLSVQVSEDVRNTSINRVVVEQVSPGFSDRYLLDPEKFSTEIQQYQKYIKQVIAIGNNETDAEKFAEDIVSFSKSLAKIMTPTEVRRSGNHLFHEVSVSQLIVGSNDGPAQWKNMNWKLYFDTVFEDTNVTIDIQADRIIIMDLPYMQKLSVLLSETPTLTVERFIWWSVFSTVAPMTLNVFRDLGFEFSHNVFGLQQRTPRWKNCVVNVNANFGFALSYLYVKTHFDQDSREKAIEMIEDIRGAFADTVLELDWMDDTTRQKTLNKLKAIRNFVGFPSWLFETEKLDKHYKHSEIVEGSLFETYLKLSWSAVKKSLESLRKKPDRSRWITTATTVNAFYSATLNSVTFPAGILQPPFYGNAIDSINYGSIGAIMGHEITHGFDDQGRRYDEEGNLKQWWTAATLEHYHTKVQCIIDQYTKYHMPELPDYNVQGFNTQGENIADNGGLRAAWRAWRRRGARPPTPALPALPRLHPDQLFYLGFAQIWCGNSTVGALKSKLVEGVHSPNKIRVIGTLSNSKEFAEAWKCPLGSPMNPEHKCVLW